MLQVQVRPQVHSYLSGAHLPMCPATSTLQPTPHTPHPTPHRPPVHTYQPQGALFETRLPKTSPRNPANGGSMPHLCMHPPPLPSLPHISIHQSTHLVMFSDPARSTRYSLPTRITSSPSGVTSRTLTVTMNTAEKHSQVECVCRRGACDGGVSQAAGKAATGGQAAGVCKK